MNTIRFQIVSCSGASNTGKFADETARMLMSEGNAKMLCLARFSIDKEFAKSTKEEITDLVVLDGCSIDCAKKTMNENGIEKFLHLHTTDFGIIKGQTPFSKEKTKEIAEYIKNLKNNKNI
jgi:uncharacterized metal-binding protein